MDSLPFSAELVNLENLENMLRKTKFGLYQDDGLILLKNLNGQQMDKKKKTIIKIFRDLRFSIDIKANLKEVHFLDVALNLKNGTYCPCRNLAIGYFKSTHHQTIHRKSSVTKFYLGKTVKNSSCQEIFDTEEVEYEDKLKKPGYIADFKCTNNKSEKPKTRNRNRRIEE